MFNETTDEFNSSVIETPVSVRSHEQADFFVPDYSLNSKITPMGLASFAAAYLLPGENPQDLYMRIAKTYGTNTEHAKRLYFYMSQHWFSPATPILSNGGTKRGQPISCYLTNVDDSLKSIAANWDESVWLSAKGGGLGINYSDVRESGAGIGQVGSSGGVIPFIQVQDSITGCVNQGSLRRGTAAVYLDITHPEIEEFIQMRQHTGGDPRRKTKDLHNAVMITDIFMESVKNGTDYDLISPSTKLSVKKISARDMWAKLLTIRMETGEPYLVFKDTIHRSTPDVHKDLGMFPNSSNLCSEITLPSGKDYLGNYRTAVCCLSSLNLEYYNTWKTNKKFIPDVMEMLDNVLQDYIDNAPSEYMAKAIYAASMERSVGLGVMGFHSLLQSMNVPFESVVAKSLNTQIFKHVRKQADQASVDLAMQRGPCPDAKVSGYMERFTYKLAIAPTASISILCGSTSPCIEPWFANTYTQKLTSGSYRVRNKYLEALLETHGCNNDETWLTIIQNNGRVGHLDCLTEHEKLVFKTAMEINQQWIIDLAADRAPYIDQSQSVNLFFEPTESKATISKLHFSAWQKGLKSLYYCRSKSVQRAENSTIIKTINPEISASLVKPEEAKIEFQMPEDTCLSCQ